MAMFRNLREAHAVLGQIEDFIYQESALLDAWRLDEWFALFEVGGTYHVPTTGGQMDDDPDQKLFYIADDYVRLRERVVRLNNKAAHAEYPRSSVQHSNTNIRITAADGVVCTAECNFIVHRARRRTVDTFFGRTRYRLNCESEKFKILSKRCCLGMDILYPGKISIIL
jgi:p-cumate 2,3-dioxygenase beta subunit